MYILSCNGDIIYRPDIPHRFYDFVGNNDYVSDVCEPSLRALRRRCLELAQLPDEAICMDASFYKDIADQLRIRSMR